MGPFESACVDRAKSAKAALYGEYEAPRIAEAPATIAVRDWSEPREAEDEPEIDHGYTYRVTHPWEQWALAIKGQDPVFLVRRRLTCLADEKRIFIDDILREVCGFFRITKTELLSERRSRSIVRPRQVGMYLAKHLTERSLPEIGRRFGNRDHTTVLHAIRKIDELMQHRPMLIHDLNSILDELDD